MPLVSGLVEGALHGAEEKRVGNLAPSGALRMRKRGPHGRLVAYLDPAGTGAVDHAQLA